MAALVALVLPVVLLALGDKNLDGADHFDRCFFGLDFARSERRQLIFYISG
jgi:hypothetical protein